MVDDDCRYRVVDFVDFIVTAVEICIPSPSRLKVTTHQDHMKTSPKFPKTIPRLSFSRRNHSPHPFGLQVSLVVRCEGF